MVETEGKKRSPCSERKMENKPTHSAKAWKSLFFCFFETAAPFWQEYANSPPCAQPIRVLGGTKGGRGQARAEWGVGGDPASYVTVQTDMRKDIRLKAQTVTPHARREWGRGELHGGSSRASAGHRSTTWRKNTRACRAQQAIGVIIVIIIISFRCVFFYFFFYLKEKA